MDICYTIVMFSIFTISFFNIMAISLESPFTVGWIWVSNFRFIRSCLWSVIVLSRKSNIIGLWVWTIDSHGCLNVALLYLFALKIINFISAFWDGGYSTELLPFSPWVRSFTFHNSLKNIAVDTDSCLLIKFMVHFVNLYGALDHNCYASLFLKFFEEHFLQCEYLRIFFSKHFKNFR